VPSLFFTLAAYLAGQYQRYHAAAALGALAVLMRQTNAVWVAFILASAVVDRCLPSGAKEAGRSGKQHGTSSSGSIGGSLTLLQDGAQFLQHAWQLKWQLLRELWALAAVVAAFAAFVVLNGGIVVGDKSHHAPVRHLMQPFYFLLYCTAWLAPLFWSPAALAAAARQLAAQLRRQPGRTAALAAGAACAAAAAVRWSTLAHPFLLADNRHFTFYLWRRVLNSTSWARYALIPAYLYSGWALQQRLSAAGRRPLWLLLLAGATCAVLVPAQLVEFRYFTIPFYLCLLHMRTPSPRVLAAVVALFAAANTATLYLFLYRPFAWPDGSTARFMW
jgi:alpha-1,2-glucosyltransferase